MALHNLHKTSVLILIFGFIPTLAIAVEIPKTELKPSAEVNTVSPLNSTQQAAEAVDCTYAKPEKLNFDSQFVSVRKKGVVAKKETFETRIMIQNKSNVPWFSVDSGCSENLINLGTDLPKDRESPFFTNSLIWKSGWLEANRIQMKTKRVDPGNVATFTFWSQTPDTDGLFREYYTPVIENVGWLQSATFFTDIKVGDPMIDAEKLDLLKLIQESTNLAEVDLTGEKKIEVSLSKQRMYIKIGDYLLKEFVVSTGKRSTPTPMSNNFKILSKQEVRVASSKPHYIMPKFMMFKKGGFGIHALPSLANDRGVFWREALNHIGTPRSHGCIRLLPQDAELVYKFADIGTTVSVYR